MSDLPEGWTTCLLGSVAEIKLGKMLDKAKNEGPLRSYLRNVNVRWFGFDLSDLAQMRMSDVEAKLFDVRDDDVLVCEGGEPGRGAVWNLGDRQLTYQKALHRVRVQPALLPKMLVWQLRLDSLSFKLDRYFTGSTIKHFPLIALQRYPVSVPPLAEQKRIADKLDTVLTRVDAVSARLARVAPILKRFRQSVLAAATSGRLTEDWRGNRKATYPKLPMAEIADMRLGKMLDKAKNTGAAVRYLRNVNVRWFAFDLSDVLELRIEEHERDGLSIMDGDLLVCEGGEPGRCAVWQGGPTDLIFQKALHRVRPDASVALSTWIAYVLKQLCDSGEITSFFTGSTIKHLTGTAFAKVPVPIPILEEQAEIVRRVDTLFAFADRLEARLKAAQSATGRLTPALLAKAFRGELVPQDPDDEPASELLRRLQAASGHRAPARAAGRGRKRST